MLVVLLGTSGVGKGSVMSHLKHEYGFNFIKTITTRPQRLDDSNKATGFDETVTEQEYEIQEAFGNQYAQRIDHLRQAADSNERYVVDVSVRYFEMFTQYSDHFFLLTLDSMEEHEKRLIQAGRHYRFAQIAKDVELAEQIKDNRILKIVNTNSTETALAIDLATK